jgi:hypothetical protein
MKKTYENVDLLLNAISYSKYGWKVCGDLEVTGLLLGMQSAYTNLCCFLCEWDSRAKDKHYKIKDWLVGKDKILLPPLHIKAGSVKHFVEAMNKYSKCFEHLRNKFPKFSDAKLKDGA